MRTETDDAIALVAIRLDGLSFLADCACSSPNVIAPESMAVISETLAECASTLRNCAAVNRSTCNTAGCHSGKSE